jgi:hypothetical protein
MYGDGHYGHNVHYLATAYSFEGRKRACEWFAEFARRLNRRDQLQLTCATSEPLTLLSSSAVAKLTLCETCSLTLVALRHCLHNCAQLSSWASPRRSPSGPRI